MKSETTLDYAEFQLSPRCSRCELFVYGHGNTEKLAAGSVKPFITHLKIVEEKVSLEDHLIKLEVDKRRRNENWFTKGTLERFVRFVSTPEILESVNTLDAEMSQLEGAQSIYSLGAGDQNLGPSGVSGRGSTSSADETKKELLRAIHVRLGAVKQDLASACTRATAAGFNIDTVSDLQLFAARFGAHRLNDACRGFISLSQKRPDLIKPLKPSVAEKAVRSSSGYDTSMDDPIDKHSCSLPHDQTENNCESHLSTAVKTQSFLDQSRHSWGQLPQNPAISQKGDSKAKKVGEITEKEESLSESAPALASQPARRLSVQDRINMFENKQKETTNGSSGNKTSAGKSAELRRLSSDVSSQQNLIEKAVLIRWGGMSDTSIDSSRDKKDGESPLCTPSSASVSLSKSNPCSFEDMNLKSSIDFGTSCKIGCASDSVRVSDSGLEDLDESSSGHSWKNHSVSQVQFRKFTEKTEPAGVNDERNASKNFATPIDDYAGCDRALSDEDGGVKSEVVTQIDGLPSKEKNDISSKPVIQTHFRRRHARSRSLSGQYDGVVGANRDGASFGEDIEVVEKDKISTSNKQPLEVNDGGVHKTKLKKPVSLKKAQIKKEEKSTNLMDAKDSFFTISTPSLEQVQRVRQSKGNQELNDELKMKADELEKLFAEHKLRVPVDQSGSVRRSKHGEMQTETAMALQLKTPTTMSSARYDETPQRIESFLATPQTMNFRNLEQGDVLRQSYSELYISDNSQGKIYDKYVRKRDAKLREEWITRGPEKEAKMKAMYDSLEKSKSEMKAKFSSKQDSVASARRRAEKVRSFNYGTSMKRQQSTESIHSEEDEETLDIMERTNYGEDRLFNDSYAGDGSSRNIQNKKVLPNRTMSSSTPRTTASIASQPVSKTSYPSSVKRRGQTENPLAQSVPNFSDLRKENAKPPGISKTITRPSLRINARIKTTIDEPTIKEEKPRPTLYLKKRVTASDANSGPSKLDKEQTESSVYDKNTKSVESKPFLRKGNGIGPGARAIIVKPKALTTDIVKDDEEYNELVEVIEEDEVDIEKEEEEDEEEDGVIAEATIADDQKLRMSQESDKSGISGSENEESMISLSQVGPTSNAELPSAVPSTIQTIGSILDSPGESPMSWNSRMHHPFSYHLENSDVDAYVDSPTGSPWNSHNLMQTEAEAARMRMKWGSSYKPTLVNSPGQSRKDVTKGFKRLLKFGRKSRGTDSFIDWISATTSEGDDDAEDGRDLANRSSDDLRKSRMGFFQGPSDDSLNESEIFDEQALQSSIPAVPASFKLRDDHLSGSSLKAPRSFFSLSPFRSKGSESKLR